MLSSKLCAPTMSLPPYEKRATILLNFQPFNSSASPKKRHVELKWSIIEKFQPEKTINLKYLTQEEYNITRIGIRS